MGLKSLPGGIVPCQVRRGPGPLLLLPGDLGALGPARCVQPEQRTGNFLLSVSCLAKAGASMLWEEEEFSVSNGIYSMAVPQCPMSLHQ